MEEQLRSALSEKDSLMAELNHRVKNNLAIISSLINLKNSALGESVDLSDIKHQIDAVRIVHDKLYKSSDVTYIEVRDYLQDLLWTVFSSFAAMTVEIVNRVKNIKMPTRKAVPVGLITNEIATNAIKYGFTGDEDARFTVELEEAPEGGEYVLILSNTGNPFPEDIDLDNPETLGLRLISALVTQLDGTIELQRKPNPRFTIRFPV
jgi:two-component sensor histidine kinase